MSYQEAKAAALAWLRKRGWPERMDGYVIQLIDFANEADASFFYPGENAAFFAMTMKSVRTFCRARGATVERVKLRASDFRAWLAEDARHRDTSPIRRQFAESAQRILHTPPASGEK